MEHEFNAFIDCYISIVICFVLSVVYISSLYVWDSKYDRDHPSTIKKRFVSVLITNVISVLILYFTIDKKLLKKASILEILGFRTEGIVQAVFLPLFLTMVLFLGPLSMQGYNGSLKKCAEPRHLIWLRNHVVAPLSEELTFRSCMLPLLLQNFSPSRAVFICPLFFGVAHFHHMIERMRSGLSVETTLIISFFHFIFTTVFGTYSAYLFLRTNHFVSIFIVHAFCNHMGVPDLNEIFSHKGSQRNIILTLFFVGLISWCILLQPLTEPSWYHNEMYNKL